MRSAVERILGLPFPGRGCPLYSALLISLLIHRAITFSTLLTLTLLQSGLQEGYIDDCIKMRNLMYSILYLIRGEVISGYARKTGSFTEINKLRLHQKYKIFINYIDVAAFQRFILDPLSKYIIHALRAFLAKDNMFGIVTVKNSASKYFILFLVFTGGSHRGALMLLFPLLRAKYRG